RYRKKGEALLAGYEAASKDFKIEVVLILEEGLPSERILNVASKEKVDLIVIGSHGTSGGKHTGMSSLTQKVAHDSEFSVLVAK
ncbi:MAG: universal stress protein, partial [Candidatus Hodarchaeota archaeon]